MRQHNCDTSDASISKHRFPVPGATLKPRASTLRSEDAKWPAGGCRHRGNFTMQLSCFCRVVNCGCNYFGYYMWYRYCIVIIIMLSSASCFKLGSESQLRWTLSDWMWSRCRGQWQNSDRTYWHCKVQKLQCKCPKSTTQQHNLIILQVKRFAKYRNTPEFPLLHFTQPEMVRWNFMNPYTRWTCLDRRSKSSCVEE